MTIHAIAAARASGTQVRATLGGLAHVGTVRLWDVKADFGLPGGVAQIEAADGTTIWAPIESIEQV